MMLGSMSSAFVLDYGLGNLYSLSCALLKSGFRKVEFISNPESLKKVDNLFLPGVGAFGKAMNLLKEKHLDEAIKTKPRQWVATDWPDLTKMDIFKSQPEAIDPYLQTR